ncbi:MAG: hypothetical protein H0V21_02895 [Rubrobacter sp.]|nr:hypothetical protein [Rubrobacter sp.]
MAGGTGLRPSYFNEIFDEAGSLRSPYEPLREVYRSLGEDDLARRVSLAGQRLGELGATFPVDDGPGDLERLLPVDWVPRIIGADQWRTLARGCCNGERRSTPGCGLSTARARILSPTRSCAAACSTGRTTSRAPARR